MDRGSSETTVEVESIDLLEGFMYSCLHLPICQVVHCGETYVSAQFYEEWDLIDKEDIAGQEYFLMNFRISFGTFIKSFATWIGLDVVVLPLSAATFFPQVLWATSTSCTVTGQSLIWLLWMTHLKSFWDGYPSFA
jgi:hypothetical protein